MGDYGGSRGRSMSPPGRGGRFDSGPRRSPPPMMGRPLDDPYDRPPHLRGRSPPDYGRKRRRDDSPPGRYPPMDRGPRDPYMRDPRDRDFYRGGPPYDPYDRYGPPRRDFPPDDPYRRGPPFRDEPPYARGPRDRSPPPPLRPQMQPPSEFPYLVSFRYFSEFMRLTSPDIAEDRDRLGEYWRRYKSDTQHRHLRIFFDDQNSSAWFMDKYSPDDDAVERRKRVRQKGREGRVDAFLAQLEKGELDDLNFDYAPQKATAAPASEAKTNGASAPAQDSEMTDVKPPAEEEPAAEPTEPAPNPTIEAADLDQYGEGVDEDVATASAPDAARGGPATEDVVLIPASDHQLFIKSIAPDVHRSQLEAKFAAIEGFDYVALSDPHTAKKLHRIGWINFKPGTDMEAAEKALSEVRVGPTESFVLHIRRASEPSYSRLRTAPEITNTAERVSRDLEQARRVVGVFEAELGDTRASAAVEARAATFRETTKPASTEKPAVEDAKMEDGQAEDDAAAIFKVDDDAGSATKGDPEGDKKTLDLFLYLLRSVFHTCYYCTCVCDFPEELERRCAKHVRRDVGGADGRGPQGKGKTNEQSWAKFHDVRVAMLVEKDKMDPRDHGGEDLEAEQSRICAPLILSESETKFRCRKCTKLFKAQNFIDKHVLAKHSEGLNLDRLRKIRYLNEFILDPSHTVPPLPVAPEPRAMPPEMIPIPMLGPGGHPHQFGMPNHMGFPMLMPMIGPPGAFGFPQHPGMPFPPQMMMRGMPGGQMPMGRHMMMGGGGNAKRPRRDQDAPFGDAGASPATRPLPAMAASMDPRSRNVLAYNDLDGQGPEPEVTLNY